MTIESLVSDQDITVIPDVDKYVEEDENTDGEPFRTKKSKIVDWNGGNYTFWFYSINTIDSEYTMQKNIISNEKLKSFLETPGDEQEYNENGDVIWNSWENIENTVKIENYENKIWEEMGTIFEKNKYELEEVFGENLDDKSLDTLDPINALFFVIWLVSKQLKYSKVQTWKDRVNGDPKWQSRGKISQKIGEKVAKKNDSKDALQVLQRKTKWVCRNYAEFVWLYFDVLKQKNPFLTNIYCKYTSSKSENHAWNTFYIVDLNNEIKCINIDVSMFDSRSMSEYWKSSLNLNIVNLYFWNVKDLENEGIL